MSRIDELIAEHCPDGVPYVRVTEVADYIRGITYNKDDEELDGPRGVLRANNITLSSNTLNLDNVKHVSESVKVRDNQRLYAGDILICAGSGSKEHIGKVAYIFEDMEETFGGFMGVVRSKANLDNRYLFHLLTSNLFLGYLRGALSTTTINNLNSRVMKGFVIPFPPLEVQREIVRILDTFSKMEAELEAELEFRKQQYEHYSSGVLSFSEEVPHLPLEAVISNLRTGLNPRKNFKLNTPDAVNHYITVRELSGFAVSPGDKTDLVNDDGLALIQKRAKLRPGDVLFSGTGTIGRTALVEFEPTNWNIKEGVYALTPMPELVLSRFLIYVLHSQQVRRTILASADGSTVASVSMASLRRIRIPLPSLESQEEIVALLDNFETLVSDLSVGLPAELAARRQQYEYYRDKLLTFKELEPAS